MFFLFVSPGEWVSVQGRFRCVSLTCMSSSCPRSPFGLSPSAHLADGTGDLILVWDTNPLGFLKFLYRHTSTQDQVLVFTTKTSDQRIERSKTAWTLWPIFPSLTCHLWRCTAWRPYVSVSPLAKKTTMKRLRDGVVGLMKWEEKMLRLRAGLAPSSTWQTRSQGKKWQTSRKQRVPSCVVCAAVKLPLCQCGTVMERFCLSPRSSAGTEVEPFLFHVSCKATSSYWYHVSG